MIWALSLGVAVGSLPSAPLLARLRGADLMRSGSANPGANNALRLGGPWLAAAVLMVEVGKGVLAVWAGSRIDGSAGAALAGAGATLGNVYNPWLGFRGGKGLAITGGTVLAAWPLLGALLLAVIAAAVGRLRRSGPASLLTLAIYLLAAIATVGLTGAGRWLVDDGRWMAAMAALGTAAMAPKHLADTVTPGGRLDSSG